jgi:hypothetical protein
MNGGTSIMLLIGPLALATLAGGIASSLTDWFFFGVLFHGKYLENPEVWRKPEGGETKQIIWSTVVAFFSCAAFILLCAGLQLHTMRSVVKLAIAIWLIAPLPLTITNSFFIKFQKELVFSHSLGWLARLLLFAIAYALIRVK